MCLSRSCSACFWANVCVYGFEPHLATFAARQKDNDKNVDNNAGRQCCGWAGIPRIPGIPLGNPLRLSGCRPDCCHCGLNFWTISAGCSYRLPGYQKPVTSTHVYTHWAKINCIHGPHTLDFPHWFIPEPPMPVTFGQRQWRNEVPTYRRRSLPVSASESCSSPIRSWLSAKVCGKVKSLQKREDRRPNQWLAKAAALVSKLYG